MEELIAKFDWPLKPRDIFELITVQTFTRCVCFDVVEINIGRGMEEVCQQTNRTEVYTFNFIIYFSMFFFADR